VNAQTEETQETALTLACCGGFLEIAELLINSDANLELGCSTPLMEAAQEGHVDLVKYLIAAGESDTNSLFSVPYFHVFCSFTAFLSRWEIIRLPSSSKSQSMIVASQFHASCAP